jgi:hypothetical protein
MDRKTFIGRVARLGILGGMALLSGILIARRQVGTGRECGLDEPCSHCPKLKSCTLPEAANERGNEKG